MGEVSVLLGRGDGTFGPESVSSVGVGPVAVAVGDFNLDGRQDLVVANQGIAFLGEEEQGFYSSDLSVQLGLGDGTFEAQVRVPTRSAPSSVSIGDFNQDGRDELAVGTLGTYVLVHHHDHYTYPFHA